MILYNEFELFSKLVNSEFYNDFETFSKLVHRNGNGRKCQHKQNSRIARNSRDQKDVSVFLIFWSSSICKSRGQKRNDQIIALLHMEEN